MLEKLTFIKLKSLVTRYNRKYPCQVGVFMPHSSFFVFTALLATNLSLLQPACNAKSVSEVGDYTHGAANASLPHGRRLHNVGTNISLKQVNAEAYYDRAKLKIDKLNDVQGALADFNQAISLNPRYDKAYNGRANLKIDKLNDVQGALADYNQAITIDPKNSYAYNGRGILKNDKLNDVQGALADYNQAITIDPKTPMPTPIVVF
jgi:tetratricopeptide (TPR) repeat protein